MVVPWVFVNHSFTMLSEYFNFFHQNVDSYHQQPCHQSNEINFWSAVESPLKSLTNFFHGTSQAWEKAMAPHSSTLAWKIPWTEEPGGLQSMRSLRVGHDWATSLSLFTFMHWRRKGNLLQCSCMENPRDGGAWWAVVYGVTQSRTRLKWLSSSSSSQA